MSLEQGIRTEIENIKKLKLSVGEINNHLSSLEGVCREDMQKKIDAAYRRGLEDAWEAAKKLFSQMADHDIEKAFPTEWNNGGFKALMNLQPQEAIAKLKAYEEHKADSIKVGDEVVTRGLIPGNTFLVTKVTESSVYGISNDGSWNFFNKDSVTKTGKHYDIQSILEAMRT